MASPEAAVGAVYASISGPAEREERRDWDRLRALFLPDARLVLVRWQDPEEGSEETVLRRWDVEAFIEAGTYESRVEENGDPVSRGINSVQLVQTDGRWWIAHLMWDVETEENPVPDDYAD